MKKRLINIAFVLLLACNQKESLILESTCVESVFSNLPLKGVLDEIEPAVVDFGYKIRQLSDGSLILFIPYWGDTFKFSKEGKFEWKISFNSKSISNENKRIEYLRGTTPDFDIYQDKLFFLHSDESISVYNLNGKEILEYSIDIPGFYSDKIKVLNENETIVCGTMMENNMMNFKFFRIDFPNNRKEHLGKYEIESERAPYLVSLEIGKAYILGDRDLFLTEFNLLENMIRKYDFAPVPGRDYNKYSVPSGIDYFSLSDQDKVKYRNDKTVKFVKSGDDLLVLSQISNRNGQYGEPFSFRLSKHSLLNNEVKERERVDWSLEFDNCGNIFQIENSEKGKVIRKSEFN